MPGAGTTTVQTPVDGWNESTLLAHLVAVIAEADRRYQQRFEEQEAHIEQAMAFKDRIRHETTMRLEQRFEGQEIAIQRALATVEVLRHELQLRHEQRFESQERAVEVALAGVEKEFHEHLRQYGTETKAAQDTAEKAVAAALAATEKAIDKQERATEMAITKQEIATEKRFEGVNEFRAQQADMIATFARKAEVDARLAAITEKLETAVDRVRDDVTAQERRANDSLKSIGSRLDVIKGNSQGAAALWGYAVGAIFLIIAVITFMNTRGGTP